MVSREHAHAIERRHAGTTPRTGTSPRVGLRPAIRSHEVGEAAHLRVRDQFLGPYSLGSYFGLIQQLLDGRAADGQSERVA